VEILSAETPRRWLDETESLLRRFASVENALLDYQQHTDRLVAFTLRPRASGAARITVFASPVEIVVEAGGGARFELEGLPASIDELTEILDAIARGCLYEHKGVLGLRFALEVRPGHTISGRRIPGSGAQPGAIQYQPYRPRDPGPEKDQ
jgi:hypothetical protein